MASKQRKPRPSVPKWFWWEDNCIMCKHPHHGCSSCKHVKRIAKYNRSKQKKRPIE